MYGTRPNKWSRTTVTYKCGKSTARVEYHESDAHTNTNAIIEPVATAVPEPKEPTAADTRNEPVKQTSNFSSALQHQTHQQP